MPHELYFNATINELFISPSYVFLLVYRNKTPFRILIVYPATFLNSLISSSSNQFQEKAEKGLREALSLS